MTFTTIICLLLLIFIPIQLLHYLDDISTGIFALKLLLQIMILQIPMLLGLLLSLALFISLLFVYGKMHASREMIVLENCGISQMQLLGMTLTMATVVMTMVGYIMLCLLPNLSKQQMETFSKASSLPLTGILRPGQFNKWRAKNQVIYVESINGKQLNNIFIAAKEILDRSTLRWQIITGRKGLQVNNLFIIDGYLFSGVIGSENFHFANFNRYILKNPQQIKSEDRSPDLLSSSQLWKQKSTDVRFADELIWRISLPVSVILLAILVVPLSRTNSKSLIYPKMFFALLIYIAYMNALVINRTWICSCIVSPKIGCCWPHLTILFIGVFLIFWQSSYKKLLLQNLLRIIFLKK